MLRFVPNKKKISLPPLINRGGFHTLIKKKLEFKVSKKSVFFLVFLPLLLFFFAATTSASSAITTSAPL